MNDIVLRDELPIIIQSYLRGYTPQEIADLTGKATALVRRVITSSEGQELINIYKQEIGDAFENLAQTALQALRDGLQNPDPRIKLAAAQLWLKHFKPETINVNLTAEDILQQLKQQAEQL
jgi:hypothetical protein